MGVSDRDTDIARSINNMDNWTRKKKAAEQCGGVGMARYIDSNEAKRIARLKKAKSSISSMTQHR